MNLLAPTKWKQIKFIKKEPPTPNGSGEVLLNF